MKKTVVLMLSIFLCLSFCAYADAYPSGWYSLSTVDSVIVSMFFLPEGCSVSLPDSMSLSPLETVRPFTAAQGVYTVGVDFPAGSYTVRGIDGQSLLYIKVKDKNGSTILNEGLWVDEGEYLGKFEFLDGYTVIIEESKAHFEAAGSGIVFDSEKMK